MKRENNIKHFTKEYQQAKPVCPLLLYHMIPQLDQTSGIRSTLKAYTICNSNQG